MGGDLASSAVVDGIQTLEALAATYGPQLHRFLRAHTDDAGAWVVDGAIPDLRYMPPEVHGQFLGIVLGGSHRENGMPGFGAGAGWPLIETKMTVEEANAVHACIIDLSWKAYNDEQARLHAGKAADTH